MTRQYRLAFRADEEEQAAANRQTASLAALALLLALVVVGLFLVRALAASGAVQDCLMAGRRNCDAVLAAQPSVWPW
jgi:uncharacterized membrane protein